MNCRDAEHGFKSPDARTNAKGNADRPRLPLPVDYYHWSRVARIWARPGVAAFYRKIRRLHVVGDDGLVSGSDCWVKPVTAEHRADFGLDRHLRGVVSIGSCPLARRLPADTSGRAVAWPHLLAMEHARVWRRDHSGNVARPFRNVISY